MKLFIEETVNKRINGYINEEPLIISEYRRESELGKSYKGREILELVQNAEDELSENMPKEIYIAFDGKTLSIANYGEPFTKEGITSLMYSNTSGKKNRKKKVIGNKGTGFRSILGWAKEIRIDSADLHIKFSEEHAQFVLENVIYNGRTMPKDLKSATLVFPEWCEKYSSTNYTTVISITIKDNEVVAEDIREQLSSLSGNLLLFLNRTEKLVIDLEGKITCFDKQLIGDNKVRLSKTEEGNVTYSKDWLLNKKEGHIGDENYTIVIAFDMENKMPDNPYLYTYFQTDVKFPFPVLLHADFNLNADRNHLYKNDTSNKQILEDAAALLVDTAIKVYDKGVSYNRIKFLIPQGELEIELQNYKFMDMLREKMKVSEIFPTVNNKYVVYRDTLCFYESGLAKYLSGKEFSDLLMYSDDTVVDDLLKELSYSEYEYEDIASMIKKWVESRPVTDDNIRKVAYTAIQFIYEFGNTWAFDSNIKVRPAFFYNLDRKLIAANKSIFLIDEDYNVSKPPVFANIEFLDPYMRNYFYKKLKEEETSDTDVIIEKLGALNVREYNSAELIQHINDILTEKIEEGKTKDAKERWKTLIKWLWSNRKLLLDEQVDVTMKFLNRVDDLIDSDELYYGAEYGNSIIEDLIGDVCPQNLVCNLKEYIVCDQNEELIAFLRLFGISESPRFIVKSQHLYTGRQNDHTPYIRKMFSYLSFPITLENRDVFDNLDEFCNRVNRVLLRRTEIELLDIILEKSSTPSILKWIQSDIKLQNHLYGGFESSVMPVEVIWDERRSGRPLATLKRPYSYIHYLFNTIPWVEANGKRYTLEDCLLGFDSTIVDLSEYIAVPSISDYVNDSEGPKGKAKRNIQSIFENLHVKRDFADLSIKKIYSILNILPSIEGSEAIARNFYNSIVDKTDLDCEESDLNCEEYQKFLSEGKILTNNGFQPVSECYYLDGKDVCDKVAQQYNLICVPKKRNKKRIKTFLGVDQLVLIGKILDTPVIHPENKIFATDFNQFKTLAFVYRFGVVTDIKAEARKFADINIILCKSVSATYCTAKGTDIQEIDLDDYDYILDGIGTYYLKVPSSLSFKDMKHNMSLASAIANIFSSYLDVSEIIPRFRELYYVGNNNDRELLIQQEFDNTSLIRKAKELMNVNEDVQDEFVAIIEKISEKSKSEFKDYIEQIDFEDLAAGYNIEPIIALFKHLCIDVKDYNVESPSITMDLTTYYESKIHDRMPFYEDQYKLSWYRRLEKATLDEKITLVDNFLQFDSKVIRTDNSVNYDVDNEIIKQLEIDSNASYLDLIELYKTNMILWKNKQSNTKYIEEFISYPENMSLLYYSLYDILTEKYEAYCKEFIDDEEINEEELYKTVETNSNSHELVLVCADAKPGEKTTKKAGSRKTTGFIKKEPKKSLIRIGLDGEQLVYDYLSADNTKQLVRWVSENAKKTGVNPEGGAGFGYDIEYVDSEGHRKYVEVKTSQNSIESGLKFYMSDYEFEFARKHAEDYAIYYVGNVKGSNPQLIVLSDVFNNHDFNEKNYTLDISSDYTITAQING